MHNDPRAYLQRIGVMKEVTKSMEAGHKVPERASPSMSKPEHKTRLAVTAAKFRVQRDAEFEQPDPPMTANRVSADAAYGNFDKTHTGKYEKLEKKVVRKAVRGSVRKALREGHNTGESMKHEAREGKAHEKRESKSEERREQRNPQHDNPGNGAVSKKISHLVKSEGKPQKQAVAMAMNMKREGRLTKEGGYTRVGKKKGK